MPVYEYQGQHYDLPDGLSNEQALLKIKTHLGETTKAAKSSESSSMGSELGRQLGLTARAGISGLSAAPNAVADFLSGAANLGLQAVGSEKRVPYMSQVQQEALNKIFPTPKPGLEQNVQTAAETVAGMMTPGMKPTFASMEGATTRELGQRAAAETAAAVTGSVVGENAAKKAQEIFGSPWAGLAAGLVTGTIAGAGVGKTASFIPTGPRKEPVTVDQLKRRASQGYQEMDDAGIAIRTDSLKNKLIPTIESELKAANFDPELVAAHKDIQDNLKLFQKLVKDPYVDFGRLEKVRSSFSSLSAGQDDTARLAKIVRDEIDSYMGTIKAKDAISTKGADVSKTLDTLDKARTDWRNASRAQVLQDILDSATARIEGATGPTGDIIRAKLVNLTSNVDKMKMFSTREKNIIKATANATDMDSVLNLMSKFNPQRGYAQTAIASGAAGATFTGSGPAQAAGILGLGAAGAGYTADKLLAAKRQRDMQNLISQIAAGETQGAPSSFLNPGLFGAAMGTTGR